MRIPLKVENPALIPVGYDCAHPYFDPEYEKVWSRAWQMACSLEMIPMSATGSNITIRAR